METIWIMYAFTVGLIFGSFANVVIYRLPRGKSFVKPRSACVSCGKRLTALELIPVFSWVVQWGRCRGCDVKISVRYPLVELLCGGLFAGAVWHSPTLLAIPLAILGFVLVCVSFIDYDTQEIPNGLVALGAAAAIVWVALGGIEWLSAVLGVTAGALPLLIIDRIVILLVKKDGFGYGDVKLMAVVGAFLGWQMVTVAYFFAFVGGGIFATYLLATGRAKRGGYMAFAPFLCSGTLLAFWVGDAFLRVIFLV